MGLKGILVFLLIGFVLFLWRRQRKNSKGKPPRWVDWVLGGMAVYYGISLILMTFGTKDIKIGAYFIGAVVAIGAVIFVAPIVIKKLKKN